MRLQLDCGKGHIIETDLPAFIMGIVNTTPDSFYEPSRSTSLEKSLIRALALEAEGADIIDIGGESTRPGASYISEEEELERVIPLIEAVRGRSTVAISVDTRKAAVMKAAFKAGATLCNDISALIDDPALGTLIAEVPQYRNVVTEVRDYLEARVAHALNCGIAHERIIIDYGIGFGKTAEDNYRLIAASAYFTGLGYPLLVGLSRKSFIGYVTGEPPEKRLAGTLAATMYAVQQGASIVRAHDVAETRELLLVLKELQKYGTT